jgi:hypothetical protein
VGLLGGNYDDVRVNEAEVPPATGRQGAGQRIRVGVVERDNGLVMAKTSQISNALYDLADQNSTTHTVLLPHGTAIKLVAPTAPSVGSYRARFEVTNPKLGKTVEAKGTSEASEVASQIDLLALAKVDKDALAKVTELHEAGAADELMIELGLREAPLEENSTHVSGYVTRDGKHVGAYSQIRAELSKLKHGDTVHFPDGITAKKIKPDSGPAAFELSHPGSNGMVSRFAGEASATSIIASRSAKSTHPKSLGGTTSHSGVDTSQKVGALPADNPKLPGAPHPDAVAARAAAARKSAKLPSRKERAANERKAKDRNEKGLGGAIRSRNESDEIRAREGAEKQRRFSEDTLIKNFKTMHGREPTDKERKAAGLKPKGRSSTTLDRGPSKGGEPIPGAKPFTGSRRSKQNLDGLADVGKPGKPHTTPSGLPLPSAPTKRSTSGGPGQRDDPSFASHRSNSDASFGDVSAKTVEGWSDRILSREIDANPGRTPKERAHLKVMQTEYRRRKTASAQHRGFIGG